MRVMGERQVRLVVTSREVSISAEPDSEVLRYPGICVVHVEDGRPVEQTCVPLGATPKPAHRGGARGRGGPPSTVIRLVGY